MSRDSFIEILEVNKSPKRAGATHRGLGVRSGTVRADLQVSLDEVHSPALASHAVAERTLNICCSDRTDARSVVDAREETEEER